MTRKEWEACISDLNDEMHSAEASGDQARVLGTSMALEAFLSAFRIPPEESCEFCGGEHETRYCGNK